MKVVFILSFFKNKAKYSLKMFISNFNEIVEPGTSGLSSSIYFLSTHFNHFSPFIKGSDRQSMVVDLRM